MTDHERDIGHERATTTGGEEARGAAEGDNAGCGAGLEVRARFEVLEESDLPGLPAERRLGLVAARRQVHLGKVSEPPKVCVGLVLLKAVDRHVETLADDGRDVPERDAVSCTAWRIDPADAFSSARRYRTAASSRWTVGHTLSPVSTYAAALLSRAARIMAGMKPTSPLPCTVGVRRTTETRTPCCASGSAESSLWMRGICDAEVGEGSSSAQGVVEPGARETESTPTPDVTTRGLPVSTRALPRASMASPSSRHESSQRLKSWLKARWMTPSAWVAPALSASRSRTEPWSTSAPASFSLSALA